MKDFEYEDIIGLPHHRSKTRPHMKIADRAAQFAPFAALTGYDTAVDEMAKEHQAFIEALNTNEAFVEDE